ncbi:class I SAM-dependent methyltransferase [Kribbella sp. DT2]|uniref:class I SAM-dependent methyltransferase n=1 Tax=Kribbella sp. DT2 TaxID=3393427 RepID=UPI003CEF198F
MSARVELRREQETMLMTLYLHARDAESAVPVLGDRFAGGVLAQIDYDFARLKALRGNQPIIVARAKAIDDQVRVALAETPDAVVLHLGCGLDSRVLRLAPGPDVTWIEVDQGPVIELRRRFYPDRDGVRTIAASVVDEGWWDEVPTGRPLLVVAEGLLMYLPPDAVRSVVTNLAGVEAPRATLIFDTVAPWVRDVARWQPNMRRASTGFESSTRELEDALRAGGFDREVSSSLVTEAARSTNGALALFIKLIDAVPPGHRAMMLSRWSRVTS